MRVLLVEDHVQFRAELRRLLHEEADILVVGEAGNGEEAVSAALVLKPDLILMDYNMPNMDGAKATEIIKQALSETTIIGLTMHDSSTIKRALLEAGAVTVLQKDQIGVNLVQQLKDYMA
jgi:DNA-binding NarL/FixJ family response regulator